MGQRGVYRPTENAALRRIAIIRAYNRLPSDERWDMDQRLSYMRDELRDCANKRGESMRVGRGDALEIYGTVAMLVAREGGRLK